MILKIGCGVIVVALLHQFCYCLVHEFGNPYDTEYVLFEKELFNQRNVYGFSSPRNFSFIFKYIAADSSPNITYAVFNIENAVSIHIFIVINFKTALTNIII